MIGRALVLLITWVALALPVLAHAQDGQCECSKNQKAIATAFGSCSKADMADRCTIVFAHAPGNAQVSDYLQRNKLGADLTQSPGTTPPGGNGGPLEIRGDNQVDQAIVALSRPTPELREAAFKDPARFTSILYLALTASIASPQHNEIPGRVLFTPSLIEPTGRVTRVDEDLRVVLGQVRSVMQERAKDITQGFFSDVFKETADGYFLLAWAGCFEVAKGNWTSAVRVVGSRAPPDCG
jgi:hypothetical protein